MSDIVCGVSLGATNLVVAAGPATASSFPAVVANDDGERVTPIAVLLPDSPPTDVKLDFLPAALGATAKSTWVRTPKRVVDVIVPLLGDSAESGLANFKITFDVEMRARVADAAAARSPVSPNRPAPESAEEAVVIHPEADDASPPIPMLALFRAVLGRVKEHCDTAAGGGRIAAVCFAVPRAVDHVTVAEIAREFFTDCPLRVISDDAAALLGSLSTPSQAAATGWTAQVSALMPLLPSKAAAAPHCAVVVDLGARTATATLFELRGGCATCLASAWKCRPVGGAIDTRLAADLAAIFNRKRRCNVLDEARPMRKLKLAAEKCKITLTTSTTANCEVEALLDGADLLENVSRVKVEGIIDDIGLTALVEGLLVAARDDSASQLVDPLPLRRVVLCGGTCRIPKVQALCTAAARRVFGDATQMPLASDCVFDTSGATASADELPSVGAAVEAQILASTAAKINPTASAPSAAAQAAAASPGRGKGGAAKGGASSVKRPFAPPQQGPLHPDREPKVTALQRDLIIGRPATSSAPARWVVVAHAGAPLPVVTEVSVVRPAGGSNQGQQQRLYIGELHTIPGGARGEGSLADDATPKWAWEVQLPPATQKALLRFADGDEAVEATHVVDAVTGKSLALRPAMAPRA